MGGDLVDDPAVELDAKTGWTYTNQPQSTTLSWHPGVTKYIDMQGTPANWNCYDKPSRNLDACDIQV